MTMKSYTAYCMNEYGENLCMTREYEAKKYFINDLHGNGYKVHFVALTEKYDEESAKYQERLEKKRRESAIRRKCEREYKEMHERIVAEVKAAAEAEAMAAEEEAPAEDQATATAENFAPSFDIIKPYLFAKVEHVGENFPNRSECVYRLRGEDVALSIWIDAAFTNERLSRKFIDVWEAAGIVEERHVFEIAMENTMAKEKPRLHAGILFYDRDTDTPNNSALLESCFNRKSLNNCYDITVTTTEQKGGAIALFYPPVCEKLSELLGGAGFYVAFISKNEGIIHKIGSLDVSAIRRNLQETNRIFNDTDTLTNEVFYYDPIVKYLMPESKINDFEQLRQQVLKGLA